MRGAKRQWRLSSTDRSGSGDRRRRNVKHGTIWLSCVVEPRAARHERLLRILKWMARVCRLFNQAMEIKGRRLYLPWAPAFFARYALQAAAVLARAGIWASDRQRLSVLRVSVAKRRPERRPAKPRDDRSMAVIG